MNFVLLSLFLMVLSIFCSDRLVHAQQQCKYEFTVPSSSGNCKVSDPEIQTKMSEIINEIDRSRSQYVSRNSIVDEKLTKLETQMSRFTGKVAEVQQQIRHFTGQSASGIGNQNVLALQKSILDTKDHFIQSIHNIENKLFTLSTAMKADSVEDVKNRAALDAEIQRQTDLINRAMDKIKQMDIALKAAVSSSNVFTTMSPPQGSNSHASFQPQLQHLAQSLEAVIKKEEQRHQQVTSVIDGLKISVHTLSSGMGNLRSQSQGLAHRLRVAETHTNAVVGTMMQNLNKTQTEMKQTITRISDLSMETQNLQSALQSLSPNPTSGSQTTQNELQNLKTQISSLQSQTSSLLTTIQEQAEKIKQMQTGIGALSPDQIMKLQSLANSGTGSGSYPTELKDLKSKIDVLMKQLVPVPSVSGSGSKKTTKHFAFAVPTIPPAGASRNPIVINPIGGNSYMFPPIRNIP